jgi:hypothetical protein
MMQTCTAPASSAASAGSAESEWSAAYEPPRNHDQPTSSSCSHQRGGGGTRHACAIQRIDQLRRRANLKNRSCGGVTDGSQRTSVRPAVLPTPTNLP